jgi:hypothetical protein
MTIRRPWASSSGRRQAIPRELNVAGAGALPLCLWDLWVGGRQTSGSRWRWTAFGGMAVTLAVQIWLHTELDRFLQPIDMVITDRRAFRAVHQWYLIASTAQWVCCLAFLGLALGAWRKSDAATGGSASGRREPPGSVVAPLDAAPRLPPATYRDADASRSPGQQTPKLFFVRP